MARPISRFTNGRTRVPWRARSRSVSGEAGHDQRHGAGADAGAAQGTRGRSRVRPERGGSRRLRRADGAEHRRLQRGRPDGAGAAAGEVPAHARPSPERRGEPARRLVRQDDDRGRARRQAQGQDGRDQGQRLHRRRADDERRLDARGLRAGRGRDHRHAHPGCRRHHPRQGGLRVLLLLRRQPHQRVGPGAQPAPARAIRPAARPRAARRWSRPARSTWRSAATRAARSAFPRRSAASTA